MSDDNRELTAEETEALLAKFDRESNVRRFTGIRSKIITVLLLLFAAYVFWFTLLGNLPEQVRRTSFVACLIFLGFMIYPIRKGISNRVNYVPWYDFVLAIAGAGAFLYYSFNFQTIIFRAAMIRPHDVYIGLVGMLILAELCRRVVGIPILFVAGGFVAYAFANGYSLRRVVHQLFYTTEGIIGTPIGVCSTFIVIFIFLASFLEKSGIGDFFIELANSVVGFTSGGPAKVAVISSALEGLISGSSVANTVGSGSVTIPMMKKTGYRPEFAAAVEATASTGGQIVPPILGAAAFIMAENTGIPYLTIAASAILPAVLYFTGVFLMVHFEAKKMGLKGLPKDQMPKFLPVLLKKGYMFLPIFVLVGLMGIGFTPAYAACFGVLAAYAVSWIRKDTRFSKEKLVEAVSGGAKNTISVGIACAVAGTIVGIVSLTGIGQKLMGQLSIVVNNPFFVQAGVSLFIALLITAIACLVLGMGLPTTANYVIMASITAPMVVRAGAEVGMPVPILAAHMFVFYFGILADITPPVALACYAGAAIAKSNPIKTAFTATRLAVAAFIVPFMFVLSPAMLLINATPLLIIRLSIGCFIGMFGLAVGFEGFMLYKMNPLLRIMTIIGGILLIHPAAVSDLIGLGLLVVAVVFQALGKKKAQAAV